MAMHKWILRGLVCVFLLWSQAVAAPSGVRHYQDPQPAPPFILTDLEANTHRLADYRGAVLILSFWATWCNPCLKELPSLQRAAKQLRAEGVRVLAVSMGESFAEVEAFIARHPVDIPVLPDPDGAVSTAWEVRALPTTYVVDKKSRIVTRVVGGLVWDSQDMIEQLRNRARQPP